MHILYVLLNSFTFIKRSLFKERRLILKEWRFEEHEKNENLRFISCISKVVEVSSLLLIIIICHFSFSLLFYEHHEIVLERLNKLWKYLGVISTNSNEKYFQFSVKENTQFTIHTLQTMLIKNKLTWTLSETIKCVYVILVWHENFQNILFDTR